VGADRSPDQDREIGLHPGIGISDPFTLDQFPHHRRVRQLAATLTHPNDVDHHLVG